MSKVVATRVIVAPPHVVWAVFSDVGSRRSWRPDVQGVEPLSAGPFGRGTRWRETRITSSGSLVTEDLAVIDLDEGRSCTIALAGDPAGARLRYVLTPVELGGGTTVTVIAHGRPHEGAGRLLRFFLGTFVARTAEGALREELAALAAACATADAVGPAAA